MAADADCRVDAYHHGMALYGPALDAFDQEHAAEISEVQTRWQEFAAHAKEVGWDPDALVQSGA